MTDDGSNYFFAVLPSNVSDYADNATSKYRVHLPKTIQFRGSWVCGLYSIQYPHSWASTVGTVEDQWMDIHYHDGRAVRVRLPKTSQQSTDGLQQYLNGTIAATLGINNNNNNDTVKRNKRSATEPIEEDINDDEQPQQQIEEDLRVSGKNYGNVTLGEGSKDCTRVGKTITCKRTKPILVDDVAKENPEKQTDDKETDKNLMPTEEKDTQQEKSLPLPENGEKIEQQKEQETTLRLPVNGEENQQHATPEEPKTQGQKLVDTLKKSKEKEEEQSQQLTKTHGEALKEQIEKSQVEKAEKMVEEEAKTRGEALTDLLKKSAAKEIEEEEELSVQKTQGEALKEQLEKGREEKAEKSVDEEEAKTRGQALTDLLKKSDGKEVEEEEEELPVQKTRGEALKDQLEKGREEKAEKSVDEEEAKTRGEALTEMLKKSVIEMEEKKRELEEAKTRGEALADLLKLGQKEREETETELRSALTRGEVLKERLAQIQKQRFETTDYPSILPTDVQFVYRSDFDRFQLVIADPDVDYLSLTPQIAYVLGFADKERVQNGEIAKYGVDLRGGFTSFAVYATGLTRSVILGNSLSSLLRIVSTEGEYGQVVEKIYDNPMFIPVHPREINELQVELRMMDGRLVPFDYGTVLVTLVFKKVINF